MSIRETLIGAGMWNGGRADLIVAPGCGCVTAKMALRSVRYAARLGAPLARISDARGAFDAAHYALVRSA